MDKFKVAIKHTIAQQSTVNWLIVHQLSKYNLSSEGIFFSFVDGEERIDEPFKTNQGYISIDQTHNAEEFRKNILELTAEFNGNYLMLANIYILLTRVSMKGNAKTLTEEKIQDEFTSSIGEAACLAVFHLLVESLNKTYYSHLATGSAPASTDEWLDLFISAQYKHSISDPLPHCLNLVKAIGESKLDFFIISEMAPILRAVLVSWYGYEVQISPKDLQMVFGKEKELAFLAAYLLDSNLPDNTPPEWLNQAYIELIMGKHWEKVGEKVFVDVYGLSYRNSDNQNEVYRQLSQLLHFTLEKKLYSDAEGWISLHRFPEHFIALFSWMNERKIDFIRVPEPNRNGITQKFIKELQRIVQALPFYMASEKSENPFASYYLKDPKYRIALPYLLLFILTSPKENQKELYKVCLGFKPLFYGGFRASALASDFAELLLLIFLSGHHLNGWTPEMDENLHRYLDILSNTILIPYVHLSERHEDVWKPEAEKELFQFSAGRRLVKSALEEIRKHKIGEHYKALFDTIQDVQIAKWE